MARHREITQKQIDEARQAILDGNGKRIVQLGGRTARTEEELDAIAASLPGEASAEDLARSGPAADDAPDVDGIVRHGLVPDAEEMNPEQRTALEQMALLYQRMRQNPDEIIILLPGQGVEVIGSPLSLDLSGMDADEAQALIETLQNWDGDMVHPLIAMAQVEARVVEWGEKGAEEEHLVRDVYLGPWRTPTAADGEREEMEGEPAQGTQEGEPGEPLPPARGPVNDSTPAKQRSAGEDSLPKDFPGRRHLEQAGYTTLSAVRPLSIQNLIDLPGIGAATATQIAERIAASLEQAATEGTI